MRQRDIVELADFSALSGNTRFSLVDIGNGRVIADFHVAHGQGSGPANAGMLQCFSNPTGQDRTHRARAAS
ncbi:murein L,D-transpeptidase catalytic domain-containing protein [Novosphingobium sp. BW1]|uniref:murein L,D-transpeptidase catalytic domain-containing protein n=1 Tax=Novosphingobium sp. BW1 TaxID=2592621 RepID=UPI001F07EC12|nr:murein L,D-transpeptidase catalytic domain family protein [Novosphingobium sp. BW1]